MGFKVWFWMGFLSRQARGSSVPVDVWALVPLFPWDVLLAGSQSWAAGALQGTWGHLGKGLRATHTILHRDRAEICCVFALCFSQLQPTVPAGLPFLSRPGHGWQSFSGSSGVLLSWVLGQILSWKEQSGIGTGCLGRWQWPCKKWALGGSEAMVGFGWRLNSMISEGFTNLNDSMIEPKLHLLFIFSITFSFALCHAPPLSCSFFV